MHAYMRLGFISRANPTRPAKHNRDVKARHTNLWKTMQKYTPEWFARAKKRGYEGSEEDFTGES